jgi:hypothetical protein
VSGGLAAALGLGLVALAAALPACLFFEPPGKGRLANAGYTRAQPVIDALEKFHAANGAYPNDLDALVPDYLRSVPPPDGDLRYTLADEVYELRFTYSPPGMNVCTYKPGARWSCYGYY